MDSTEWGKVEDTGAGLAPQIYFVMSLGLSGPQVGTWGVADGFLQIADVEIL